MTDGVLVVVDCSAGMCLHTETVLRHALLDRVKPVLALSKLDQAILDRKLVRALTRTHVQPVQAWLTLC
jgi:elongation factor 2